MTPLLPDLSRRDRQPEWMDDPGIDEALHRSALRGLGRINRVSGVVGRLWGAMRPLAGGAGGAGDASEPPLVADARDAGPAAKARSRPLAATPRQPPLRVLDLGCGGGDVVVGLWRRARAQGREIQIGGCDRSPTALEVARERASAAGAPAHFFQLDLVTDELPSGWDVLYCSLLLHHFGEADATLLLSRMRRAAARMVLVDDLARDRAGYLLCWVGVRLLSRSPVVHADGLRSVRAAFSAPELTRMAQGAELEGASLTRHWPQRLLLTWRAP